MNLTILYQMNSVGEKLLNAMQKMFEEVEYRVLAINSLDYYQIDRIDRFSSVRRIINTPRAVRNSLNMEQAAGILSVNNIHHGLAQEETVNRSYEVLIADMEAISIKVTTFIKGKQQSKYIRERDNQKIADLARRVAYLIGLDIAMVTIVLTAKRRYKVVNIDSSPEPRDKDFNRIMDKIKNMAEREAELRNIQVKMGADPEFMILNSKTGKMLSASEFFPRDGIIGCDNIRVPNRQQRPIAEVRPRPALSPIELSSNIRQALISASRLAPYQNTRWLAGSQPVKGYSIGGHIHFSNIRLDGGLLRALDNYLGIPIFLIENPTSAARRRRKYGFMGDYRIKDHGGFEYRTPGSWLMSQKVTTAVLCLAKIVANRYAEIPQNYLNTVEAQKAFYKGDQDFFRPIFHSLWANLKKLDLYEEYQEELQIIPEMIDNQVTWDEKIDLRKGWKLTQPTKREYNSASRSRNRPSSVLSANSVSPSGRASVSGRTGSSSYYSRSSTRVGVTDMRTTSSRASVNVSRNRRSVSTTSQGGRITSGSVRGSNRVNITR
ncbi:MAG: putative amidoligase domain-containing protein [Syntrophomonadaceae bacterium]|jgi:hypothetical protein|nr:hypothetical protein [Bacillota bacterium]NLP24967.1 hypothetical protein [Syntrophomonadaceae bacterium]